jgi:hypothetical protein
MDFYSKTFQSKGKLILFSQGISPNSHICFKKYAPEDILLFTSTKPKPNFAKSETK